MHRVLTLHCHRVRLIDVRNSAFDVIIILQIAAGARRKQYWALRNPMSHLAVVRQALRIGRITSTLTKTPLHSDDHTDGKWHSDN